MKRWFVCMGLIWVGCANSKPYEPLDYDKMGLETHNRGTSGAPEVGSPDGERIGHEKIEALQDEATKARKEGAKAVEGLSKPASQPASQPSPK